MKYINFAQRPQPRVSQMFLPVKNYSTLKFMLPAASATTGVPYASFCEKLLPKFTVITLCKGKGKRAYSSS